MSDGPPNARNARRRTTAGVSRSTGLYLGGRPPASVARTRVAGKRPRLPVSGQDSPALTAYERRRLERRGLLP